MTVLKGIIPPIITPMNEDESINEPELRRQVNRLIEAGGHGLFPFGTNGEGYILTEKEKERVLSIVIEETDGRVPVYAGSGCIGTKDTIRMCRMAESLGADVLSVITPWFAKASDEELEMLTGCTEIEAGAREFFKLGVQAAVITRGAKGCVVCTPKTTLTLNTYDTKVVDTTGSGDSFFGAFLTKLMETGKPVSEINEAELRDAADFANAAGSVCATKKGAIPALADRELIETCRASIPLLKL